MSNNIIPVMVFRAAQAWKREYRGLSEESLIRIWFLSQAASHPLANSNDLLDRLRFKYLKEAAQAKNIIANYSIDEEAKHS